MTKRWRKRKGKLDPITVDRRRTSLILSRDTVVPWLEPINSYNPVIHRIKEAVFHASLVDDLKKDPVPPPHPELTKFFHTPEPIVEKIADLTERLRDALDIKKVPLKVRQKKAKDALRDDEG